MTKHTPLIALLAGVAGCSSYEDAGEPAAEGLHVAAATTDAWMPAAASGWARVVDRRSSIGVRFRLADARASRGALDPETGSMRYAGAAPQGGDLVLRPSRHGIEDLVEIHARPARETLDYVVELENAAALRVASNVVEVLDEGGAPRLRVARAHVIDARGSRHRAALDVAGCAVDRDPRLPWGRALPSPGADRCTLRVSWGTAAGHAPVEYPIVVDPVWEATADMAQARIRHSAALLDDGRVLVVGGAEDPNVALPSIEAFDEPTGTWAAAGDLAIPRMSAGLVALPGGDALIVGGRVAPFEPTATLERWLVATGTTAPAGELAKAWSSATAVKLAGGKVLIAGGFDLFTEYGYTVTYLYDPMANGGAGDLAVGPHLGTARAAPAVAALADGGALVASGDDAKDNFYLDTAERLDPSLSAWTPAATMPSPRYSAEAVTLPDGDVLVISGVLQGLITTASALRWDVDTDTWSSTPPAAYERIDPGIAHFGADRILVVGGFSALSTSDVFDIPTGNWLPGPSMSTSRQRFTATRLSSGAVIAVGGDGPGGPLASAEILALGEPAAPCDGDVTCASGFCVSGTCCDTLCDDPCFACTAAAKGGGRDGVCEPVLAGTPDPKTSCENEVGCGETGTCDGAGACAVRATGDACSEGSCPLGTGTCDGGGVCVCDAATCSSDGTTFGGTECSPYRCDAEGCLTACVSSTECIAPYKCDRSGHCTTAADSSGGAGDDGDDGGCSFVVPRPPSSTDTHALALVAAAACFAARRRRRSSTAR